MEKKLFRQILLIGIIIAAAFTAFWHIDTVLASVAAFSSKVILPSFIGLCIAFIISIPSRYIARGLGFLPIRYRKGVSLLLSILLIIVLLVLLASFVLPELINAISLFISSVQLFSDDVSAYLSSGEEKPEAIRLLATFVDDNLETIENWISSTVRNISPRLISGTLGVVFSTVSSLISFFISFVIAIYFILSEEMLRRHIGKLTERLAGHERTEKLRHTVHITTDTFRKFVVAQCLEAVIIGVLCTLGMLLFRMPYALMIGSLTGVTALIPVYGAFIGAGVGTFIIAVVNPVTGILFLLFIIVLQQLEGNLIYPRVVGSSLGLPAVYTFLAVTVAGAVLGLVGMLFAVPLASVSYTLLREERTCMQGNT